MNFSSSHTILVQNGYLGMRFLHKNTAMMENLASLNDLPLLELNSDFQYVLDQLERGVNMFVTGRAGTGKSTLLQLFRNTTHKRAVVLAPTGVAALNVKGQTIHSFFGFPPRMFDARQEIKKRRNRQLYDKLDILVIDEISMVRADMLDHIDYFLRLHRENNQPFGGVQMVFFGDLFQLPPVVSSEVEKRIFSTEYSSPYFFSARVMQQGFMLECLELSKVYRQDNRHFLKLLDAIRNNRMDYDDLQALNTRFEPNFASEEFYITLSARNATVDAINRREIDNIALPARVYMASTTGDFPPNLYPTEAALQLKLNAQVMMLRNDPDKQYVNGTIGRIVKLEDERITILVEEGPADQRRYVETARVDWEILRYKIDEKDPNKFETETIGSFTQFPLRLAWAVTIHKAQGKTFDKVIIDLGSGAFEHGQTYVALSRCRTLEGIVLRQPLRARDVMVDEQVVTFYEQMFR